MKEETLKRAWLKLGGIFCVCFALCFCFAKIERKPLEYHTIVLYDFTRTVGTGYQPSIVRDVVIQSSVSIASVLNLTAGQSGTINLQTSPDGVTYTTKQHTTNNNTGSLTLGFTTQTQDTQLGTVVPKGYWYKFVAVGTATMSTSIPVSEIHF